MRVLAIGATGFIGPHVVRLLIEQGHEVAVLHRNETSVLPAGAHHLLGDRNRLAEMERAIELLAADVVLDVVPYTERQAREVVDVFRGKTGRLIALSSADVYRNYDGLRGRATAPPDAGPLDENAPLRETRYPYRGHDLSFEHADDYEKIDVEQVMMNVPELPAAVLRLPAVYGPGDAQHRLRPYLRRMIEHQEVLLQNEQAAWRWTRGFVENVAAAIALAVVDARSAGRIYNVGEEPAPTEQEWVERIGAAANWNGAVVSVSANEWR